MSLGAARRNSNGSSEVLTVHQAIARALADSGVDTLFGLIGDANLFLADSFVRNYSGKYVAAANESGAAAMALGYSLISKRVGAVTVTHGPAVINTLPALSEGVKGSIPLVLLCGDTSVEDPDNLQNINQREFVMATGAGFEQLRSPRTVAQDVARVMRRAIIERRPIALNIPTEFNWLTCEYVAVRPYVPEGRALVPASTDLDNAVGMIAAAKRPIILAGRGACTPEARAAILKLARRIEAPLATTLKGKGLFGGDDFDLGIFGTLSTPVATDTILKGDCVIAFGASLNKFTVSHGALLQGKRVIQVNLEQSEVGKHIVPDAGLVGDPALVADLLIHWLDQAEVPPSGFCDDDLRETLKSSSIEQQLHAPESGKVDIRRALVRLDKAFPANRILISDAGRFVAEVWRTIGVTSPDNFINALNSACLGIGVAHGIGAFCAARERQPVMVVCGDGGFMHAGITEFNTAVRHGMDIVVVVCNDGAYGAEYVQFRDRQLDPGISRFVWPELAEVAVALGGEGVSVGSDEDLEKALDAIGKRKGPILIDLKLDPDRIPPIPY